MLRSRRKKSYCQNCQYPLTGSYNFCPQCGQENSEKLVSFPMLINDFFINYFSYDSRLARTIGPFLLKPGFLTKEFVAGRRTKYMHPLRLYLIISFFYFLFFSFMVTNEDDDGRVLSIRKHENTVIMDSIGPVLPEATSAERDATVEILTEYNPGDPEAPDPADAPQRMDSIKEKGQISYGRMWTNLEILLKEGVTPEEVLSHYNLNKSGLNIILARQAIKLANERKENVIRYLIKNATLMMFLLLPFFALLLKLFYIRRNKYYVEHITFTLNIHSFLFLMLLLVIAINYFWPNSYTVPVALMLIFIYFLLSLKNVYQQSWFKTIVKMFFLAVGYMVSFIFFLLTTVGLSFFFY